MVVDEDRDPWARLLARGIQDLFFRDDVALIQEYELKSVRTLDDRTEQTRCFLEVQRLNFWLQGRERLFIDRTGRVMPFRAGLFKGVTHRIGHIGTIIRRCLVRGKFRGKTEAAGKAALAAVGPGQEPVYLNSGFHNDTLLPFDSPVK
jgi:hypothetical protein